MPGAPRHRGFALLVVAATALAGCNLVSGDDDDDAATDDAATDETSEQSAGPGPGTIILDVETVPAGQSGSFTFTGVPTGTVSGDGTLVVSDLEPGTYTTTEVDPAPDFDVTAVDCDDDSSPTPSSGDATTRTGVVNLDADETVRCTFTNTQRGSVVIASRTVPEGSAGSFWFTGVPTGTIPANGTLVTADLEPGTYTSTLDDPAPDFDLTAVDCDDGASPTTSSGDPTTRSAVFNLDPGEMVTCTFTNTRRATAIAALATEQPDVSGDFLFTGVPTGTVRAGGTLVTSDLIPGTYTTTLADPAPDFELIRVECDDDASSTVSSGDPTTRSAIFNLDPGESTTCTFVVDGSGDPEIDPAGSGGRGGTGGGTDGPFDPDATDPFEDPGPDAELLPDPEETPDPLDRSRVPRPGPWEVDNQAGSASCGGISLPIPDIPVEFGTLEVLDGGRTVVGTPTNPDDSPVTMTADPSVLGLYTGSFSMSEQGADLSVDFFWAVVSPEYIVGYLYSSFEQGGVSCEIYRPYELRYNG